MPRFKKPQHFSEDINVTWEHEKLNEHRRNYDGIEFVEENVTVNKLNSIEDFSAGDQGWERFTPRKRTSKCYEWKARVCEDTMAWKNSYAYKPRVYAHINTKRTKKLSGKTFYGGEFGGVKNSRNMAVKFELASEEQ